MSSHVSPHTGTLAQCMLHYQLVEESLRFCLYRIQTLIKFRLVGIQLIRYSSNRLMMRRWGDLSKCSNR